MSWFNPYTNPKGFTKFVSMIESLNSCLQDQQKVFLQEKQKEDHHEEIVQQQQEQEATILLLGMVYSSYD